MARKCFAFLVKLEAGSGHLKLRRALSDWLAGMFLSPTSGTSVNSTAWSMSTRT